MIHMEEIPVKLKPIPKGSNVEVKVRAYLVGFDEICGKKVIEKEEPVQE